MGSRAIVDNPTEHPGRSQGRTSWITEGEEECVGPDAETQLTGEIAYVLFLMVASIIFYGLLYWKPREP